MTYTNLTTLNEAADAAYNNYADARQAGADYRVVRHLRSVWLASVDAANVEAYLCNA